MANNDEPLVKRADGKKGLTKHDLNQLWYRWQVGWFSSSSYEKLESHGFCVVVHPLRGEVLQG